MIDFTNRESDTKQLYKILFSNAIEMGFDIMSRNGTTPTLFWDEQMHRALSQFFFESMWQIQLFGFCVLAVPRDPLKWATHKKIFKKWEDRNKHNTTRFSCNKNESVVYGLCYQELLPVRVVPAHCMGYVTVHMEDAVPILRFSPTSMDALDMAKEYRFIVYTSHNMPYNVPMSNELCTPLYTIMLRYKELGLLICLRDKVAAERANQLILVHTELHERDPRDMTSQDMETVTSMSNSYRSSDQIAGNVTPLDEIRAKTKVSAEGIMALSAKMQMEKPTYQNVRNTALAPTYIESGWEPLNFQRIDDMMYKALDTQNLQAQQVQKTFARIPTVFKVHSVYRPEFNQDITKLRIELKQELAIAMGGFQSLLVSKNTGKGTDHSSDSEVNLSMRATLMTFQGEMASLFQFTYSEAFAPLDQHHAMDVVDRLHELMGDIVFNIALRSYVSLLKQDEYAALLQGEASQTLKEKMDEILAGVLDPEHDEWLRQNKDALQRIIGILEQFITNHTSGDIRLEFTKKNKKLDA